MAFFKSIIENMGHISQQIMPKAANANQDLGFAALSYSTSQNPEDREAIFPQWFFNTRIGQPRGVDTRKLRDLAKSPWAQMVINTFKKQIQTVPWEIVAEDEEDETDHTEDIKTCMEFFKKVNDSNQNIDDINSEAITDIAEIDAGCMNYVYSADSYTIGPVPIYNQWGNIVRTEEGLLLNPLGQRTLVKLKSVDGSSMLKQVDIHKNILGFWQYSFKHPRQNPTRFENEEIEYVMMNGRSYDVYGFSPMQAIQQVLELLIQGTRYNKDLYTNNAIPDVMVSLPKLPKAQLNILKRKWNQSYKGKPHQVGFINWAIDKITKLNDNNRDLEWLSGQQWYFKIVFAVFGVSPEEAGFTEDSNKATGFSQERVTVRNALKPYFKKFESVHTNKTISEILQREDHGLKFVYKPKDQAVEQLEFDQAMKELEVGALTINEYRKTNGKEPYDWGDEPYTKPSSFGGFGMPGDPNQNNNPDDDASKDDPSKDPKNNPNDNPGKHPKKSLSQINKGNLSIPTFLPLMYTHKNNDIIDAGDELVNDAKDYSDFLLKFFDTMEKRVLSGLHNIQSDIDKQYTYKTFGEFLRHLFNTVNTVAFREAVRRFIRIDLTNGVVSAEKELNVDIGFTEAYELKLNLLASQQIDGYLINGKKWPGIKGVTKEIQAEVIQIVQGGINEKSSLDDIRDDIKKQFDNFSDWRSEMIARTETTRITNEGKILGYQESGMEGEKVWSTAMDNRTSPICKRLHNQSVDLHDDFIDPETMKAFTTPPAHPNCRSTISFRPK